MIDGTSVFTLGHSTKTWQEFVDLLVKHQIRVLADIRRFPGSRRYPHFNQGEMRSTLQDSQIKYAHLEDLGGRRQALKGSKNIGWRSKSFRGYADHMSSGEFKEGIGQLIGFCREGGVAIMCAEALPWQCHRMLVSDYLAGLLGLQVSHIMPNGRLQSHSVTAFAQAADGSLTYPEMMK
jgi:uncharacterized protein (DUF488 family)